jgi:hypothetical protein
MVCRIGGVTMPWIINYLFNFGTFFPFLSLALIALVSATATFLLPRDTVAKRLDEDTSEASS